MLLKMSPLYVQSHAKHHDLLAAAARAAQWLPTGSWRSSLTLQCCALIFTEVYIHMTKAR